jgi:hypothetical protein
VDWRKHVSTFVRIRFGRFKTAWKTYAAAFMNAAFPNCQASSVLGERLMGNLAMRYTAAALLFPLPPSLARRRSTVLTNRARRLPRSSQPSQQPRPELQAQQQLERMVQQRLQDRMVPSSPSVANQIYTRPPRLNHKPR